MYRRGRVPEFSSYGFDVPRMFFIVFQKCSPRIFFGKHIVRKHMSVACVNSSTGSSTPQPQREIPYPKSNK